MLGSKGGHKTRDQHLRQYHGIDLCYVRCSVRKVYCVRADLAELHINVYIGRRDKCSQN